MINEIKCDLFKADADAIIHSANCFHIMGGGVARYVRELFPEAYEADCKTAKGDINKLGTYSFAKVIPRPNDTRINPNIRYVINLYGQFDIGRSERKTSYDAFEMGLSSILRGVVGKAKDPSGRSLAIPYKMGCNLGGGNWNVVRAIIGSVFDDSPVRLYICKYD